MGEDGDEETEKFRAETSTALGEYYNAVYEAGKGTFAVFGSERGTLTVVISAKNLNIGNYWSGGWYSFWKINVSNKGSAKLEGTVKTNVHYFEDGNVQLNTSYKPSKNIEVSDPGSTARAIVVAISKLETKL